MMGEGGPVRWRAVFGWIGTFMGLVGAGVSVAAPASGDTPRSDYRPATSVPASWQAFARRLQSSLQERLASEDDIAGRLREALAARPVATDALTVRAWVLPTGQIERLEFDQLDPLMTARLRVVLSHADVGVPPFDMLQPVRLRLVLRPKTPAAQEQ
jgi:hypothetical protein